MTNLLWLTGIIANLYGLIADLAAYLLSLWIQPEPESHVTNTHPTKQGEMNQ